MSGRFTPATCGIFAKSEKAVLRVVTLVRAGVSALSAQVIGPVCNFAGT